MSTVADGSRRGKRRRRGGGDGGREMPMVPDVQFTSYYGRPVVKPAPWTHEIAAYLFLGGLAGGSGILAAGASSPAGKCCAATRGWRRWWRSR